MESLESNPRKSKTPSLLSCKRGKGTESHQYKLEADACKDANKKTMDIKIIFQSKTYSEKVIFISKMTLDTSLKMSLRSSVKTELKTHVKSLPKTMDIKIVFPSKKYSEKGQYS